MPGSSRRRRLQLSAAAFSIFAGAAWVAKDIGGRISPDPDYWNCNSPYDYALNGIDVIAFLFVPTAILALRALYREDFSRTGVVLGYISAGGLAIAGVSNLLEHCAGAEPLGFAYVIGLVLGMLLLLPFELFLTRTELPVWGVVLLLLGTAAGIFFANQGGPTVFGASWIVLGVLLLQARLSSSPQSGPPSMQA
jgi:hypothetical protein